MSRRIDCQARNLSDRSLRYDPPLRLNPMVKGSFRSAALLGADEYLSASVGQGSRPDSDCGTVATAGGAFGARPGSRKRSDATWRRRDAERRPEGAAGART